MSGSVHAPWLYSGPQIIGVVALADNIAKRTGLSLHSALPVAGAWHRFVERAYLKVSMISDVLSLLLTVYTCFRRCRLVRALGGWEQIIMD
ncbi:hypothetical protein K469DRAFT_712397 [Zopfia rhizophila CBS 207.26]|uniref:Uncharacterized protein n=1 Tax=Zopfia rhizophila CBS 207.26 TaxID=1314779 RepID=A0A6A6EQQ3_9PEZI|nr:hypothetical protein K469DRAFT_712397 [Zopfia rhizophila CBS 207.26]